MKKILIIDDDPEMLALIRPVLQSAGYDSEGILEWEKTYRIVNTYHPDLIIIDVYLQGMDGRMICQNIKSAADTRHIPVILCSAHNHAINSFKEYGADDVLPKPIVIEQFLNQVRQFIN